MKVILFGAGKVAKQMMSFPLQKDCQVVLVCDNDKTKWGGHLAGVKIASPLEILSMSYDFILLAVGNEQIEIKQQLLDMGVMPKKIRLPFSLASIEYCESPLDDIFFVKKKEPMPFVKGKVCIVNGYEGETAKCRVRRQQEGFFDKFCQGEGLDIGYGGDLVVPGCSGWDLENGDAQYLRGIEDETFDFVYSSHCLEHMINVRTALQNWFRVVRPGGYLIVAVPHRDLYEKRKELPSRWNIDHKHMFLPGQSELPDTLNFEEEIHKSLTNYRTEYIKACDEGHTIIDPMQHSDGEYQIEAVIQKLERV